MTCSGALIDAGGAVNIQTTSPSARERIIQSVGVHLFVTGERIPQVGTKWRR